MSRSFPQQNGAARPQRKLLWLAVTSIATLAWFSLSKSGFKVHLSRSTQDQAAWSTLCSPTAYDQGSWQPREPSIGELSTMEDVYRAVGYKNCLAQYQKHWNWGLPAHDGPYDDYAEKFNYEWQPHPSCRLPPVSDRDKLQALVDRPLYLAGDSRTRQHFFALSCELAEHTIWKGAAAATDDNTDTRAWRFEPQHLFLDLKSPLVPQLRLSGFNTSLPLLSYLMFYHPLSRLEMLELKGPGVDTSFVPSVVPVPHYPTSELSMNRSMDFFTSPDSHYKVMTFSTTAHFGPAFLRGGYSVADAQALMRASLKVYFPTLLAKMRPDQRLLVRAAAAAHSNCDNAAEEPLFEASSLNEGPWFNYGWFDELNDVLEAEAKLTGDSRVSYWGTGRLSRLRPDAHLPGDCHHISVGSGIFEAISRYMWHIMLHSG